MRKRCGSLGKLDGQGRVAQRHRKNRQHLGDRQIQQVHRGIGSRRHLAQRGDAFRCEPRSIGVRAYGLFQCSQRNLVSAEFSLPVLILSMGFRQLLADGDGAT